ncbi:MAG: YihY/virulence factor BrkB family protein [Candidatus Altiarchaeota archaeon]|nr:YihY/virulence factor BrkB family protein [Candidatus Altiarchaeota archaeon]
MNPREFAALVGDAFTEWNNKNISLLAASLAYYAIFSLAPLLVISISVFDYFSVKGEVKGEAFEYLQAFLGDKAAAMVEVMMGNMGTPNSGLLATVLGVAVLIYAATGIFFNARRALNTIWDFAPRKGRGLWYMINSRLLSFALVMGVGSLLLVSVLASTLIPSVLLYQPLTQFMNFIFSFISVALLFSALYMLLPSVRVPWVDVYLGAALASLLFNLGNLFVGLYLDYSDIASLYGAAGSLVLILVWVYYSAQIFLFGAVFTKRYSLRFGSRSS